MIVPPTSLVILRGSHEQIESDESAWRYIRVWSNTSVVIENDTVIHGHLFVAAAIRLEFEAISVMDIDDYERGNYGVGQNPCAEIYLAGTTECNLSAGVAPPPQNTYPYVDSTRSPRRDLLRRFNGGYPRRRSDLRGGQS